MVGTLLDLALSRLGKTRCLSSDGLFCYNGITGDRTDFLQEARDGKKTG